MRFLFALTLALSLALAVGSGSAVMFAQQNSPDGSKSAAAIDFPKQIQPILAEHCYSCHGPEKQKSGLRLDLKERAFRGGDTGAALIPGKSEASLIYKYVAGLDAEIVMPPKGDRLKPDQISLIKTWIDGGAPWPNDSNELSSPQDAHAANNHWAFHPPQRPQVPIPKDARWAGNPIDAFIAVEQENHELIPTREASRRTLIRRLSLDLIGLPPTQNEINAFVADDRSNAYEQCVERLLASPSYGERWGRHWLDLARWAESDGYEANEFRSSAWRYRDYVVKSFNTDKPYDQFLREQIAGDEMAPYSDEKIIATGFLAAGRLNNNEEDKTVQRNESLVDMVNATASVTLGLTLGCAQCHDHKFDPLTARDFYRFQGFFVNGQVNSVLLRDPVLWKSYEASIPPELEPTKKLRNLLYDPVRARLRNEARMKLSPESLEVLNISEEKRTPAQKELAEKALRNLEISKAMVEKALTEDDQKLLRELDKKIGAIEKQLRERKPQTWSYYSPVTSSMSLDTLPPRGMYPLPYDAKQLLGSKPHLLKRGDVHRPGAQLEAGWPEVFGETAAGQIDKRSRLVLANWLTSSTNPLVARVWVNYLWQQHFGHGIVATPGDFGVRGAKPTHPKLLDWLATELIRSGWRTKQIHRLIVLSATYRQASEPNPANLKRDPDNKYLWRWSTRRLESETIRDSALAVSGELDKTVGGPSVTLEDENKLFRRSIYLRQKRHEISAMQALFDGPSGNESCPRRYVSTVSLQPLYLLNDDFMLKRAERIADRVRQMSGDNSVEEIEMAFQMLLGRSPESDEKVRALEFLNRETGTDQALDVVAKARAVAASKKTLPHLCHALLNLNESIYLD